MKIAKCKLKSKSPYQQGRHKDHEFPKNSKESAPDHEERTWRERGHYTEDGYMFIPPTAFANSLKQAAKYLSLQIPGKGQTKYTKHFEAATMVAEPLKLPLKKEDVQGQWLFVPSDGKPGGGKRVMRCFPTVFEWEGTVNYYILDDTITKEIFEQVLRASGDFIGIGVFRPINRGYYGRFEVEKIDWQEQ